MIRFLTLLLFIQSILLGCSICSITTPRTDISINITADKTLIKNAHFKWTFSKEFTEELLRLYDTNLDLTFSKQELEPIEESLLTYIEPLNYLTFLSYSNKIEEHSRIINIKSHKISFVNNILSFEYVAKLNYKIIDKNKLYIRLYDDYGYFSIFFDELKQSFTIPYNVRKDFKEDNITYTIDAPSLVNEKRPAITNEDEIEIKKQSDEIVEEKELTITQSFKEENLIKVKDTNKEEKTLDKFVQKIKEYLLAVEKGEDKYAMVFLLFASFVYGMIHALGPGHGKALAFSYFSSRKSSYTQAFTISFFTAFIHIVGALILVSISIFIIEGIFSSFLDDSISYITKTSAVLIMLLSLFILYRKLKNKSCACCACNIPESKNQMFTVPKEKSNFVLKNPQAVHTSANNKKENLFFVLTAGLIPCPGTVVLFVYAFILETYLSVFLASIFISLGMGIVIFVSSFLGVSLHKVSAKSSKFTNFLEIASPIFMFFLGLFLLLSWETI